MSDVQTSAWESSGLRKHGKRVNLILLVLVMPVRNLR